jgi:integrase
MPLTDARVRNSKPQDHPVKISDAGGLHLLITTKGSKLWRLAYRYAGKQKTLAIGAYPTITLEEARDARAAAKKLLAVGTDPGVAKKTEKRQERLASVNTFKAVAEEWTAKKQREGLAAVTLTKTQWLLGLAYPSIGNQPVTEISSAEILDTLRTVEKRGHYETAQRLRGTIGGVFRYAIATARAEYDPTVALRGALTAPDVTHQPAITDPSAFGALLRAIDGYEGQPTTRVALQLMAFLFPRPGELRAAQWVEFDLDTAVWTIPAVRTKMRREHRMPLPVQALSALLSLKQLTGTGELVFPSIRSAHRPMSENTMNAALRRMGFSKDEMTSHGFRASASTMLNESRKWLPDVIERQLAHLDSNEVRRAYARGDHWEERVRMLNWWAEYLVDLKTGGNALPLKSRQPA